MILVSVPQGMCHLVEEKGFAVDRPWCEVAVDLEGDQAVQGTEQAEQAGCNPAVSCADSRAYGSFGAHYMP